MHDPLGHRNGEIADAARAKHLERARKLRILKYRMLFIFLLLPALLVVAIVFDWLWTLNLSGRMTRDHVLAVYAGLIAAFVLIFLVIGFFIRKRLRREDDEALKGPTPVERAPNPASMPISLSKARSRLARPEDTRPENTRSEDTRSIDRRSPN